MQTTLLSLAIALILALLAALVGPYLVDWTRYQAQIEARATTLVGAPVEVSGPIVVRLLPTPSLALHSVAVTAAGTTFSARALRLELALGPLLRGDVQASELQLEEPRLRLALDREGGLSPLPATLGVDPDRLAIERISIADGRLTLADGASGRTFAAERLFFSGDLRSLAGPLRGDGRFATADGDTYRFRVSTSRAVNDTVKLRFGFDAPQWPLTVEADGTLVLRDARPRYQGSLTLSGPASAIAPDGRAVARDPWKATAQATLDATKASLDDLELNYGPEDRLLHLTGKVQAAFGALPRFTATLSGRQIVLDRLVAFPGAATSSPVADLLAAAQALLKSRTPPLPGSVDLSFDQISFAGNTLQNLHATAVADAAGWAVTALDFRAPGATQIGLGGRLQVGPAGLAYAGPLSLVSGDPGGLAAALDSSSDAPHAPIPPASLTGALTFNDQAVTLDRLQAEIDGKPIEGRLAYAAARPDHPARLDATLTAAEIDLDNALAIGKGAFSGLTGWPREVALALRISRATYAGVDAGRIDAKLALDGSGLTIERLAIGDLRGASIQASGQIATAAASPQGAVTVALTAARPEGVLALLARAAPQTAEALSRYAAQLGATDLHGRFEVAPAAGAAAASSQAKLTLNGTLGAVRINFGGTALGNKAALEHAKVKLTGSLEAADGRVLATLAGVDRLAAIEEKPALVTLAAEGSLDGAVNCDLRLAAGGLSATATGTLRFAKGEWSGKGDVALAATDARALFDPAAALALPASLDGRLALNGRALSVDGLKARFGGADVAGRLALNFVSPIHVEGRLDATDLDAAAIIAVALAAPRQTDTNRKPVAPAAPTADPGEAPPAWSAEPFANTPITALDGHLSFTGERAKLLPGLQARGVRGSVRFDGAGFTLDQFSGSLADGALAAEATVQRAAAGLSFQAKLNVAKINLAQVAFGRSEPPVAGTATLSATLQGAGRSPAALIGSLSGKGTLALDGAQLAGLDPKAIETTLTAAERGLALDRLPDYLARALDGGKLTVARGETTIEVADGRLRVAPLLVHPDGAEAVLSGALNLATDVVDARFTLSGRARPEMEGRRPEVAVTLHGPIEAPTRSIDTAALVTFATLQAVEREANRVDAAERARAEREHIERERADRERLEQMRRADEARRAEAARRAEEERRAREGVTSMAPAPQREANVPVPVPQLPQRTAPAPDSAAPGTPPPAEIRPAVDLPVQNAPMPRQRPSEAARAPQRTRPPDPNPPPTYAPPPDQRRSLWDFLFRNPNP